MDQKKEVYEIHGTVTGRNSDALRDARVVVWWQHIRERQELAAGETSEHGRYHLRYKIPENAPQPLLLVVEAHSEHLDAPLFFAPDPGAAGLWRSISTSSRPISLSGQCCCDRSSRCSMVSSSVNSSKTALTRTSRSWRAKLVVAPKS